MKPHITITPHPPYTPFSGLTKTPGLRPLPHTPLSMLRGYLKGRRRLGNGHDHVEGQKQNFKSYGAPCIKNIIKTYRFSTKENAYAVTKAAKANTKADLKLQIIF